MQWFLRVTRWTAAVCFGLAILLPAPAFSKIYKWVDENGNVQFTDDENKIPPKYRSKGKLETVKPVRPLPESSKPFSSTEEKPDKSASPEKKGKEAGPGSEADEKYGEVIGEAIQLLEGEIQKDREAVEIFPSEGNGRVIVDKIQSALPGKKELLAKIEELGLTTLPKSLAETQNFLSTSIARDSELQVLGPAFKTRILDTQRRLAQESSQAEGLIAKLQQDMQNVGQHPAGPKK